MKILGISAFYHDSAATLISDGEILFACQEERLTRIKHDSGFPCKAIEATLKHCNMAPEEIDAIVFFEKPFLKFERLIETYLAFAPKGFYSFLKAIPLWLNEKLFQKKLLSDELVKLGFTKSQGKQILFSDHHLSHAASAFFASGFSEALVLTMDGVGEWQTTTVYKGSHNSLQKVFELRFPHSLGLLYSAFTYHCGFKVNSGEYKLMGLAPYGTPRFTDTIKKHLIDIKDDGSFKLNMKYFDYCVGLKMTNQLFNQLFENSQRQPEEELKVIHMDLSASIQVVLEEVILKMCHFIKNKFQIDNLCLAGGVALNCAANGRLYKENIFKNIWVQPAAGDAGGSLGAALGAYYLHFQKARQASKVDIMQGTFLGPQFSNQEVESVLLKNKLVFKKVSDEEIIQLTAAELKNQKTVGWFQGRMEFGPRALGNRSILADGRSANMQKTLNLKIKFRESFRPFAPALLEEDIPIWFDREQPSPYMMFLAHLHQNKQLQSSLKQETLSGIEKLNVVRSEIPAVTHVDYSSRLQSVNQKFNPKFHSLLTEFKRTTGCSVLINTSFNIRGEPIACTPEDAMRCFLGTDLDLLVIENFVLFKKDQPQLDPSIYKDQFDLD